VQLLICHLNKTFNDTKIRKWQRSKTSHASCDNILYLQRNSCSINHRLWTARHFYCQYYLPLQFLEGENNEPGII